MAAKLKVGVLTVSDSCFNGVSKDTSGGSLKLLVEQTLKVSSRVVEVSNYLIVKDDVEDIKTVLKRWCDEDQLGLILTTGGTGFSPRDVTPEATKQVIEKEAHSLSYVMLQESLKVTHLASLSRSVCGIRGQTLIINFPGSKKASQECLSFVLPVLPHALDVLHDIKSSVKTTHDVLQSQVPMVAHSCPLHFPPSPANVSDLADDPNFVARRHRHSPWPMKTMDEALTIILKHSETRSTELVSYKQAFGRYIAENIYAPEPLPPFPASIKDGYAVLASDGKGERMVIESSIAGDLPKRILKSGECTRINTGAPVPDGADSVVQVEDTKLLEVTDDGREEIKVEILKAPSVGQDIRPVGSDIQSGQLVLSQHMKIKAAELGILATVGITSISCYKSPVIGVMSTGNELVEPEASVPGDGKIRDSNRITLLSLLYDFGFEAKDLGIAKDAVEDVISMLNSAFEACDVIITSGGVSMGEKDLLKSVLLRTFSANIEFGQVFMKPGKPTTFATVMHNGRKKLFFGLPGNPVSATVTCYLFVLPCLRKLCGDSKHLPDTFTVKLDCDVLLDPRPEYMRAVLSRTADSPHPLASITGNQISSRLLSVCSAQALVILPPASKEQPKLPAGSLVEAILI